MNNHAFISLTFFCLFIPTLTISAQFKNSQQNEVGRIYNAETKTINFSGGETSIEIKLYGNEGNFSTRYSDQNSAKKKFSLFAKAGITNSKKFIDIDEFDFKENNGLLIGLSARWSFDDIYILKNQKPFQYETFIASIQYSYDKFNLYDPSTQITTKETPGKLELKFGWNHYCFRFKKVNNDYSHGTTIVFSLNGSYNPLAYNSSDLISFAEIDNDVITDGNVFAVKSFDGKYGMLDNGVQTAELALSLPILFDYKLEKFAYIFPVPYVSTEFFSFDKPMWNVGMALGFASKPIFGQRREDKDPKTTALRKFNNPSSLSIGVDWSKQGNQTSEPNFFITGNVSF
ncbi:hypothetical protein [Algibacter sp. 2305UL17-15]|uniref:hypothetical protein n=1 Tax=Algibacter sp. 2305UL17-15 TaxID=3231268 RepID=UPI003459269D